MLVKRKRLRQGICHIQIRMHFGNLHTASLYVLSYHMEASENVFGGEVRPWLLGVSNGTRIVAEEDHGVLRAWEHSKFDDELPQPHSFIRGFASSNVLRLLCRLRNDGLLPTSLAHGASIHLEHITCL